MGVTIAYRGRIKSLGLVTAFEDRLVELASEIGGRAVVWRTALASAPNTKVRGVVLYLEPTVDSVSFLLSPEGWLIPLHAVEDAEGGPVTELPWIFVKTQFGSIETHVTLVEVLDALRETYFPDLDVYDDGAYWESRSLETLRQRREIIERGLDLLQNGVAESVLSSEAREDPRIVAEWVSRLAEQIHSIIQYDFEPPSRRFSVH